MALGKRKREQQGLWVVTTDLPKSPGHPFYKKLNQLLAEAHFDGWIEKLNVSATGQAVRRGEPLMDIYAPELVAAQSGLGALIWQGKDWGNLPLVLVGMVAISITVLIADAIAERIERLLLPWERHRRT